MVDFSGLMLEVDYAALIQHWVGIILLTIVIAFALPVVFVIALRYTEKYDRESWRDLLSSFIWGATVAVVAVILIRGWFLVEFRTTFPMTYKYIAVIVVTPIAAEMLKATGLFFNRDAISESEDGLIHGGTIGLGYSATENLLYGIFLFATYGFKFFVLTMAVRSFSIVLINCVTTAIVCYGITRFTAKTHTQRTWYLFPLFYLGAVGISGTFNFFAMWGQKIFGAATVFSYSFSLIFSIVLATVLAGFIYFKVYRLDRLDDKPKDQQPQSQLRAPPTGRPPPRQQYRPPPDRGRNVQTGYVPRGNVGGPGQQRPPPRQQPARPPRQSLGPQGPPRPIGPHNRPPKSSPPPARPPARAAPARPARPAPAPPRPAPAASKPARPPRSQPPKRPARGKVEMEDDEEEFEFSSRKKSGSKPGKRATFEADDDEVEFTSRKSSSKKKSSGLEWEEDDDDDDDWFQ